MNSKQRRKDRKRWRYSVTIGYTDTSNWGDDAVVYQQIWDWCAKNFGTIVDRCGWRDRDCGDRWEFDCPKKAALFALRWSGK